MAVGEILEVILEDVRRVDDVLALLQAAELDEETFAQVAGSDSGRIELLDDLEHVEDLILVGLDVSPERQVVDETVDVPAQVAVFVEAADYEGGDRVLSLVETAEAELLHQALGETLLDGKCIILRPFVFAVVVDAKLVCRNLVVFVDLGKGNVSWRIVGIVALGRRVVEDRILFQFLADTLFQLLHRQLDKFYRLDLQGRKFLLLF